MHIDLKSLVLGAILGSCYVVFKATISVTKDRIKEAVEKEEA